MKPLRSKAVAFLKWSQKYTRTDMAYLAKGGFWLTIGQVALAAISLSLSVALANLIPPQVLGQYKFVIAGAAIIGAFSLTGMGVAAIQAIARGFEGTLISGARESLRWSFGIVVLSLGVSIYYYLNDSVSLALSFFIVGLLSPIISSTALFTAHLNGTKRFAYLTFFSVGRQFILACSIILTIFLTSDPLLLVLVYFATDVLVCLIFFTITALFLARNKKTDPSTFQYSKHLSLMEVIKIIAYHIDKVLVFTLLGAGPLAVYTIAMAPITQLKGIDHIIANLAFPKFSQRPFAELQKTLARKVILLTCMMAVLAAIYILLAPHLFNLLFPKYLESVIYSQVYTVSLLVIPSVLFVKALTAHKKTKQQYILKLITPSVRILLLIILVPIFGLWGVLSALIFSELLWMILAVLLFFKGDNVRFTPPQNSV